MASRGSYRIMIAGGGTGGHVFPMISVADALKARNSTCRIIFVGTEKGIESRLVAEAGYELWTVKVGGLKGKSILKRLVTLFQLPFAMIKSAFFISKFGPHIVIGGGGYASWPFCMTASLLGIPLTLMEVNSLPGMANRKLAPRATEAYIAFKSTAEKMKCPTLITGNPTRRELKGEPPSNFGEELKILVIGGSQGAVGLNSLVLEALPHLKQSDVKFSIIHQSGQLDYDRVSRAYMELKISGKVAPFINEIGVAYRNADLVISRAGATSVAELIAARRPAILVPLPSAADNHQEINALEMVNAGGGILARQNETDGSALAEIIAGLYRHRVELSKMGAALSSLDHPDAAGEIAERILALLADTGMER